MSACARGFVPRLFVLLPKAPGPCTARQAISRPSSSGFLLRPRIQILQGRPPARLFQLSASARAAAPKTRAKPPSAAPSLGAARAALRSYAEQLAARGTPTALYEAPSHFWLRVSAYGAGVFCICYAVSNYWSIFLKPPQGLPWWVPHAFAVICVTMGAMGGWFLLSALNIVRSVRAVPVGLLPGAKGAGGAARWAKALAGSPVALEVTLSRILPLLPARKLVVAPAEVALPFRMQQTQLAALQAQGAAGAAGQQAGKALGGREKVLAQRAEEEARQAARKYDMDHLLTAPFRHFGQAFGRMWRGATRALTRDGFAKVQVKGKTYKIDITSGWALDNGRALDRLVSLRPDKV